MCGFAGVLELGPIPEPALRDAIARMTAILVHRGPDDHGLWVDPRAGVALGHRRLSILDLSPQGHQPMVSHCGRFVLAFNGEIYNHQTLRRQLGSQTAWRGHSDTEVLLAWISRHGAAATLPELNGMFAFALWDRVERQLTLARDRLGEKPLYYGRNGDRFLFGSELKALTAHPHWQGELDRDALTAYLRLCYIPAPYSIYRGIHKLEPGTYATLAAGQFAPEVHVYWSARHAAERGLAAPFQGTETAAVDALESLLGDAVGLRMQADVPLGAFLSGGIDSTTVVALMQAQSTRPVRTFSIGFHEAGFDEAVYARPIAEHLGTDHTELYVTARHCLDTIADLPRHWDEPFADSSQIPTLLVSEMAKRDVTVCLSGDGGDELFGGYSRYLWTRDTWRRIGWLPLALRRAIAAGEADYAVVNTYYIGQMLTSSDPQDREVAEQIGVFFPNQEGRGAHVNISGVGVTKVSDNVDGAMRLIEFLLSDEAQQQFAQANYEYPAVDGIAAAPEIAAWGEFEEDPLPLNRIGELNSSAVRVFDEVGWQ